MHWPNYNSNMPDSYRNGWIGTILGMVFIIIIIGFSVEFEYLSYVLKAKGLVVLGLKVGIAISFLAGLIFWDKKQWPSLTRIKAIILSLLVGMILGGWLTLMSNRVGGLLRESEKINVIFEEETAFHRGQPLTESSPANVSVDRYLCSFSYQGERYQLSLPQPLFTGLSSGDQLNLEVARGLWGYKYILPPE